VWKFSTVLAVHFLSILICEIQVKNGLDLGENYRNINGCKTFAAPIAQTLVDKQVKFHPTNWDLANY
jgi:hypothetical protein